MARARATIDVWTADVGDAMWRPYHTGASKGDDLSAEDLSAIGRALRDAALDQRDDGPHNLSHSDRRVVFAVARGPGVTHLGVDIELLRPIPRADAFARRILADGEVVSTSDLVTAWTLKEAALKATGAGLTGDPRAWRFQGHAAEPRLQAAPPQWTPLEQWAFLHTTVDEASVLALAVRLDEIGCIDVFIRRIRGLEDMVGESVAAQRLTWSPEFFPATS